REMADDVAAALQEFLRVRQSLALQKAEAHVIRDHEQREDCRGRFLVWRESDDESVVVVVDQLKRAWSELPHFRQSATGIGLERWRVFGEEGIELLLGCCH